MELVLNQEQLMLKNAAREFFTAEMPVSAFRALRDNRDELGFDRAAWDRMADMGWTGVLVPEADGGVEFGYVGCGQLFEEAGRTLAASPLLSNAVLAAPILSACASQAIKSQLLSAIVKGESLVAVAIDEQPRHAPSNIATEARATESGFELSGRKVMVLDGHVADWFIVLARTDGQVNDEQGLSLFLLDAHSAGVECIRSQMVDSRNSAILTLDRVRVDANAVLGTLNDGAQVLTPILDGTRACLAAEMLGSGLEAFERTLAYLRLREQFGVAIGSFQALKHRAALMYCELELTRSAVMAALVALEQQSDQQAKLASLAKAKASEMLELVSSEAVQLHGGIGMTDEEEIGLFLKRARVAQASFGDASYHRDRYATLCGF